MQKSVLISIPTPFEMLSDETITTLFRSAIDLIHDDIPVYVKCDGSIIIECHVYIDK